MAADIISDTVTAWSLFSRYNYCNQRKGPYFGSKCGNNYNYNYGYNSYAINEFEFFKWGAYTLILIVMPLIARIVLNLVALIRSLEMNGCEMKIIPARWILWIEDLKQLPLHFPLLQPIR